MTCNEEFYAGIGHITDAYKRVCRFNEELHADLEKYRAENAKLRELVRSAVRCITDVPDCDSCALGERVSGVWVCHLIGAAKELGIEVSE